MCVCVVCVFRLRVRLTCWSELRSCILNSPWHISTSALRIAHYGVVTTHEYGSTGVHGMVASTAGVWRVVVTQRVCVPTELWHWTRCLGRRGRT